MPLYRAELLAKKPLRYAALIHDVSQVLYLPFDWDDDSYARDRSGYGNHGTIYGAARAGGKIGMALSFDGVDDYVNVPHSASLVPARDFTIMFWMKRIGTPTAEGSFFSKEYWLRLHMNTNGDVDFRVRLVDGTVPSTGYYPTPLNEWIHYTGVLKGTKLLLYLDGKLVSEVSNTGADLKPDIGGVLHIAHDVERAIGIRHYPIVMDEVRIYNRALSQDEIRMLMYRRLI